MERLTFRVTASFWAFLIGAALFKKGYLATMYALAVILHESAHYVAAKRLAYRCTEIRLNIFGAVLYGDFADIRGADRIKVALAGPLCNFVLCLFCLALWWIFPQTYYFTECFFQSNLSMGCVNLLPCYPLDGGRILTGLLDKRENALRLTKIFTYVFSLVLFGVFVVSLFTRYKLFNVALFSLGLFSGVFTDSGGECYVRNSLVNAKRYLKRGMEKKILVFDENCALSDVAKRMVGNYLYCLEVADVDMNIVARYGIAELENIVLTLPLGIKLKDIKIPR